MSSDPTDGTIVELAVTPAERESLGQLARSLLRSERTEIDRLDEATVVVRAERAATSLPARIGDAIDSLRGGRFAALVLRGSLDPTAITHPTPIRHGERTPPVDVAQAVHALLVGRLGQAYGYLGQQHGRIFNDIVPVADRLEVANFSGGTHHRFEFHTEDAFHPARAHWITLMCRRNPDLVPTILAVPDPGLLGAETLDALSRPMFRLRANPAQGGQTADRSGCEPVVAPGRHGPAFRYNFCVDGSTDPAGRRALDQLLDHLLSRQRHVRLAAGDCLLVDNERAFHARDPYVARLDGSDRWMQRVIAVESVDRLAGHLDPGGFRQVQAPGGA